ncbi:MAG: hypothetical protein KBE09_00030 [Candidatus Pacebacteria bacterium]|nr:hypothetical protein [Candidatus Paceibacterota bacterium]
MPSLRTHALKYVIGILVVIGLRLLPHPPNIEPITATLMPFGKHFGVLGGAIFGLATVLLYDMFTGTLGAWSLLTMGGYVLLGVASGVYFKKDRGRFGYLWFAIVGTIAYDLLTGLTVGPLVFGQPFMEALVGQLPFTLYHLAGNILLALAFSPLIEKWVVMNPSLTFKPVPQKA